MVEVRDEISMSLDEAVKKRRRMNAESLTSFLKDLKALKSRPVDYSIQQTILHLPRQSS